MKLFLHCFVVLAGSLFVTAGFSQKLVDPSAVAPEYREAAEKRRAEQIRQNNCALKAEKGKVMMRERAAFINSCLETADKK